MRWRLVALGGVIAAGAVVAAAVLLARGGGERDPLTSSYGVAPETFASVSSGVALLQALDCVGRPLRVDGHAVSGSGFLVGSRVLMTAEHGVWVGQDERACGFRARLGDGWYHVDRVKVWRDPGSDDGRGIDVATMTLTREAPGHVFRIASQSVPIGAEVAALGYPLGLPLSFAQGILKRKPLEYGKPTLAAQLVTEGGASGGPIVNKAGEVVGLVRGLIVPSQGTERSLYGGLDLASWFAPSAVPDLCGAHPDRGVPGCDSAARGAATKVAVDVPRPS